MNEDLFAEQLRTLTELNNARQREVEGYFRTMTAQRDQTVKQLRVLVWLLAILMTLVLSQTFALSSKMESVPGQVTNELRRQS
ncbi:MAG: hypothetical protein F6K56_03120 [Moorea sp. SIO3G5]|nr:hypothetical protein [Moorena sp. SIO3G5]